MCDKIKIRHYIQKTEKKDVSELEEIKEEWFAYFRANPHRFITEYIGGTLYDFQCPLIYGMDKLSYTIYGASRGLAKTSVGAWFAITRAILYPEQKIAITAFEKSQIVEFIKRIEGYSNKYPNLAREIKRISTSKNDPYVIFENGSTIFGKTNGEQSRSSRAEIVIVDEFALFKDREIIKNVFGNFLTNLRTPPYLDIPKKDRRKYLEPNKEIYLSSIRTEAEWSWQYFLQCVNFMADGDERYFPIALPYHYGVRSGYITEETVAKQFREDPTGIEYTKAEFEVIPIRNDASSFYQYKAFESARKSTDVLIAMTDEEYALYHKKGKLSNEKMYKWKYYNEKKVSKLNPQYDELRIMGIDIALIGGKKNDNTCIDIFRCQPNNTGYKKILAYSETMHGKHHKEQALRIKQLFYEMECDYLIIDCAGNGVAVCEALMDYTKDVARGVTYEPWCLANPDEVNMNTLAVDCVPLPVMYGFKANSENNSFVYRNAKSILDSGEIELPAPLIVAQDYFNDKYGYANMEDNNLKKRLMNTFVQTDVLVIESTNLVTTVSGLNIKLEPVGNQRKDRFTAWAYGLYLVKRLEDKYRESMVEKPSDFLSDFTFFA